MIEPENPRDALDVIDREAHDWVVRFASGAATAADLRDGKLWCARSARHAEAFAKASRLWDGLGPEVFGPSPQARAGGAVVRPVSRPITRRLVLGGALAASAAAVAHLAASPPLGLWPSLTELAADYRTETGEQRRVEVAETIRVDMNTQTSIAVRTSEGDVPRIELIAGEAVFATVPRRAAPVVVSGDGRVSAENATFNMRNTGGTVCVTCLGGLVTIAHRSADASLTGGQQITYDRHRLGAVATVDPAAATAWQEGKLIFRSTPLVEVVSEINRYRPGKIILLNAELGTKLLSAVFHVRNVDTVVGQIERLFGAKATTLPGGIVVLT